MWSDRAPAPAGMEITTSDTPTTTESLRKKRAFVLGAVRIMFRLLISTSSLGQPPISRDVEIFLERSAIWSPANKAPIARDGIWV